MANRLILFIAGVAALVMPTAGTWAQEDEIEPRELVDLRACKRHKVGALSEEEQEACEIFRSLDRQGRYKAIVMQRLRKLNKPPVAAIEIIEVLPRRVDVSAEGSTDEDGFPELHHFALLDADTGDVLAGPITTRQPGASLETNDDLPENLLVRVVVEDDLRAIDTAEEVVTLTALACSNEFFNCISDGTTTCEPGSANTQFTTTDVLDAAQRCDPTITKGTQVTITARGGVGGKGADFIGKGGARGPGGAARIVTTLTELDLVYGSPEQGTTYCYGLGSQGSFTDTNSGGGGAATLLRTCDNVSQTAITGVLLIAGGGGGGRAAALFGNGRNGHAGGVAASSAGSAASGAGAGAFSNQGGNQGEGGSPKSPVTGLDGRDGVGGKGGDAYGVSAAGWWRGQPKVGGDAGQGAFAEQAGGGGGGWGGGASESGEGGGGGGSYAAAGLATASNPGTQKTRGSLTFAFAP